jgi:hypothetical protein
MRKDSAQEWTEYSVSKCLSHVQIKYVKLVVWDKEKNSRVNLTSKLPSLGLIAIKRANLGGFGLIRRRENFTDHQMFEATLFQ